MRKITRLMTGCLLIGACIAAPLYWYGHHLAAQHRALLHHVQAQSGVQVVEVDSHWANTHYLSTVQLLYPAQRLPKDLYPVLMPYLRSDSEDLEQSMLAISVEQQTRWQSSTVVVSLVDQSSQALKPIFNCTIETGWSQSITGQCQDESFTLQSTDLEHTLHIRELVGYFKLVDQQRWESQVQLGHFELLNSQQPLYALSNVSLHENLRYAALTDWIGETKVNIEHLYSMDEGQPLEFDQWHWQTNIVLVQDKIQATVEAELEQLRWQNQTFGPVAARLGVSHFDAPAYRKLQALKKTVLASPSDLILQSQYETVNDLIARVLQNTPQLELEVSKLVMPLGSAQGNVIIDVLPNGISNWSELAHLPQYLTTQAKGVIDASLLESWMVDYYQREHRRARVDLGPKAIQTKAQASASIKLNEWISHQWLTKQEQQYVAHWSLPDKGE